MKSSGSSRRQLKRQLQGIRSGTPGKWLSSWSLYSSSGKWDSEGTDFVMQQGENEIPCGLAWGSHK